jgi:hypothetical protein
MVAQSRRAMDMINFTNSLKLRCCIDEATMAVETTKERWSEAEVHHR